MITRFPSQRGFKATAFTPFFTTKSQGKGMGLGLSIARDIIRAHHGTVSVKSQGGEGTTVVMELPVAAA
jgi:two-component system NtrC family sensor kinase